MDENAPNELRQHIALAIGAHRNGQASDGQGWFRDDADMAECYALADALLPVMQVECSNGPLSSPDHIGVYVDDQGLLYTDYPTVPSGDHVVRLAWDEGTATSKRELETEHGATFTRIGWCK